MATETTSSQPENVSETQAAAELILQREEMRQEQRQKRAKRRRRKRRQEELAAVRKMHQSIEVIKWCAVAICTVWLISFIISIVVLINVQNKVADIEEKVHGIQEVMENPFAHAGARVGGELDEKWRQFCACLIRRRTKVNEPR